MMEEIKENIEKAMESTKDLNYAGNGVTAEIAQIVDVYFTERIRQELSLTDIYRKTGIAVPYIQKIEQYKIIPRLDVMLKLLHAVDGHLIPFKLNELVFVDENPPQMCYPIEYVRIKEDENEENTKE